MFVFRLCVKMHLQTIYSFKKLPNPQTGGCHRISGSTPQHVTRRKCLGCWTYGCNTSVCPFASLLSALWIVRRHMDSALYSI